MARPGEALEWSVTRRGTSPPPNSLNLTRHLWLDLDGTGYTIRDRLRGTMRRDWRLDYTGRAQLGHVRRVETDENLLITQHPETGTDGVELRHRALDLRADLRLEGSLEETSIVGWAQDAETLDATLHLPPGWSLFTATGVDDVGDSWLGIWTLWDIFFVLIVAFSVGKLFGWRWTPLALAALVLSYGFSASPHWTWLHLIVATALLRVLPDGWWRLPVHAYRGLVLTVLFVMLSVFTHGQIQSALHPQTGGAGDVSPRETSTSWSLFGGAAQYSKRSGPQSWTEYEASARSRKQKKFGSATKGRQDSLQQIAPDAVVQTGPGVPSWEWTTIELDWSGPVAKDHRIDLWLIPPIVNRVLNLLRIVLVLGLGVLLTMRPGRERRTEGDERDRSLERIRTTLLGQSTVWLMACAPLGVVSTAEAQTKKTTGKAQQHQPPHDSSQQPRSNVSNDAPPTRSRATFESLSAPDADDTDFGSHLGEQLDRLESRLLEASRCDGPCLVVPRLDLEIDGSEVTIRACLHARADTGWSIPGPRDSLVPTDLRLDGESTRRLRRGPEGLTALFVPEGRHTVELEGRLPRRDIVTLQFGDDTPPRYVTVSSDDWTVEGLKPSGAVGGSIQLTRVETTADASGSPLDRRVDLPPWFRVDRHLELGMPWRVETTVARTDDARPERLEYPLLKGENVITEGVSVESGRATIHFETGESSVSFQSELDIVERLELRAPDDQPWTETWTIECSRIWHCDFSGLSPTRTVASDEGVYRPVWHPWPGETLDVAIDKPEAVPGDSKTIESVTYDVTLGQRLSKGMLKLKVRATQGGRQRVTLPKGATLQSTTVDGESRNLELGDDRTLELPIQPGEQTLEASWQQPWERHVVEWVPTVEIEGRVVNVETLVDPGDHRWIFWTTGPEWGPAVLFWSFLLLMIVVAILLGQFAGMKPTTLEWVLLVAGFSQVPVALFVPIVAWFAILTIRREHWPERWWTFDLLQLTIVGLTCLAAGSLYAALHTNFLVDIDMQIQGAQSHDHQLRWYVDRITQSLPRPSIVTLPIFVWRFLMLAWALWLVNRLLVWVPWGWDSFSRGGLVASWRDDERGGDPDDGPDTPGDGAYGRGDDGSSPEEADSPGGESTASAVGPSDRDGSIESDESSGPEQTQEMEPSRSDDATSSASSEAGERKRPLDPHTETLQGAPQSFLEGEDDETDGASERDETRRSGRSTDANEGPDDPKDGSTSPPDARDDD